MGSCFQDYLYIDLAQRVWIVKGVSYKNKTKLYSFHLELFWWTSYKHNVYFIQASVLLLRLMLLPEWTYFLILLKILIICVSWAFCEVLDKQN